MQRLFLILTASIFLAWVSWLTYLAVTSADPIVVSHPQMNVAPIIVVAELGTPTGGRLQATVKQVYRGKEQLPNQGAITLVWPDRLCGWQGPGMYLLALRKQEAATYQLEPIPLSPGYHGLDHTAFRGPKDEKFPVYHVIYPWTESVRVQLETIVGEKGN